jgi:hypothetical protein
MADTRDTTPGNPGKDTSPTPDTRDAANAQGTQPTDRQAAPSAEQLAAALNPAAGAPPAEPIPELDETVPGGAYKTQSGTWVDAEGQPLREPRAPRDAPKSKE